MLTAWLKRRAAKIKRVVTDLRVLAIDEHGTDIREKYAGTNLGPRTEFRPSNLTQDSTIPGGPFDLILCWEFIHVFHDIESLGGFIDSMLDRLAEGGRLVITNIREVSATIPQEQEWAREHLEASHVRYWAGFISISESSASGHVPFERRLHAHYPVVVVEPRSQE
jgi:2-polyprenyl-3-methyl-5-hydroxy-6-metoxy-1,4-benzoquinol methylase